ncbi:MAG: hypothetical protein RL217_1100 [Pseudomonadota bacterium]|jgi:CBS domain-containing protein
MKKVSDLMIQQVCTLKTHDNLQDAEQLMGSKQIRHIPVVDSAGKLVGLLTQKEVLAEAFRITDKFGAHLLKTYLAQTSIDKVMRQDMTAVPADMNLKEAGAALLQKRSGCILVVDAEQQLLGILSSQDFVRLAPQLL